MQQKNTTLGFLGIGLMGSPIATRLLKAAYPLTVWNRSPEKLFSLIQLGAQSAQTPAEVAEQADILFLSLADSKAVESVVFGSQGVASGASSGKLLVDLSSIEPETTQAFAERLQKQSGMSWLDAPISGGVVGAEQGTLAVMAGGSQTDFDRVAPIMSAISQRFTHMGEIGAGQITKACNQMIVSCNALVIAEVIALARKAGIDAEKIPQALAGGFADSKPLQILGPQMVMDSFEPIKWHVRTLLKDLDTAVALSRSDILSEKSEVPMTTLGAKLMRKHSEAGFLESDPATLIKLYKK